MTKTLTPFEATEKDMALINSYSRRKLEPDEIYTFSMILCANDIDRDGEAFTKETLVKMSKLFQGTTGIFDHITSSKNQIARIFKTSIIKTDEKTIYGEDKYLLKAWAYMLKTDYTKNLILKIDAGIVKEISVSCSIRKKICSICGKEYDSSCNHILGKKYDNSLCYIKLIDPYDAYEWSFVAVPSQLDAKITKSFSYNKKQNNDFLEKANNGEYYETKLKSEITKLSFLSNFMQKSNNLKKILEKLSIKELEDLKKELKNKLDEKNFSPFLPQTANKNKKEINNSEYLI